jgi:hypothetical protein
MSTPQIVRSYSVMARRLADLLNTDIFIHLYELRLFEGQESGQIGVADLKFEIAQNMDKGVALIIPACPVFKETDRLRVALPRLNDGSKISMNGPFSDAQLQRAFLNECEVFVKKYPELTLLLSSGAGSEVTHEY